MDFKAKLLAQMAKKRKAIADVEIKDGSTKFFKRGDLEAKREQEYLAKQEEKLAKKQERETDSEKPTNSKSHENVLTNDFDEKMDISEIRKKLRQRNAPICLFGEEENDIRRRLRKLEIEQPDMKEGWSNELQTAMKDIGKEMDKAAVEGTSSKLDVALPTNYNDNWQKIEKDSTLLGIGDEMKRDCDIISSIIKYILARWAKELNDRPADVKKTARGMHDAAHHKQTIMHLKNLTNSLERYNVNNDIRHHLARICRLLVIDRNYLEANNAYMAMAIGNAPWPVGVTRSGIHQRPGSAKSYVSNIAHVLNDETQRKYIQAFKRLMTKLQEYFPTDPSKSVEFVKNS
ncbi:unnamed protein product [Caenorhabditis angaria]|uniref:Pre-mRNA-splicing factor 18 n=1 Tax=Caenorhabditis angaria TaxID=860376 RepID=A0A9P1INZ4_9PELO|nr:unnamed protein product [Caenorhabditis angaria]